MSQPDTVEPKEGQEYANHDFGRILGADQPVCRLRHPLGQKAAQRHRRRVPEATLLLLAALGGGVCMYITMKAIRHKTLHKKFMIGLPLLILLHGVLAAAVIWRMHFL